jgi:hypothetical protein
MCLFWRKKSSFPQNQQANFNQTWYKSFLGKGYLRLYNQRSSSKGEIITKIWLGLLKIFLSIKAQIDKKAS